MRCLLGLILILLLAAGCGPGEAPTRIAVRLETDMTQGDRELATVDVELYHEGAGAPFFMRRFDLTATVMLPGDVLVTAQDPTDTRRLVVIARANVVGGTSFAQRAVTSFARGRLLYLQMFLARRCITTQCPTGMSCGRSGCEPDARPATPTLAPQDGAVAERDATADVIEAAVDVPMAEAAVDVPGDVAPDTARLDVAPDVLLDAPNDLPGDLPGEAAPPDAPADVLVDIVDAGPPCPSGMARCGGTCIGVLTDANNCGACGNVCPATTMGGVVDCFMGRCRARCLEGLHGCGATCASDTSVDSCGTRCDPCPVPPNASGATCSSMGQCAFTCNPGFTASMDTCVPAPPRAIAPLSSATTTTRSPTLTWTAPAGIGAIIEVCSSPTCASGADVHSATVLTGSSYMIPRALDAGRYYWRMYGVAGGVRSLTASPIWSFVVRARGTPVSSSWGTIPDLDGDGVADVLLGFSNNTVRVYRGVRGAAPVAQLPIDRPSGVTYFGLFTSSAGDFDGDGDVDYLVGNKNSVAGGGTVSVLAPMRNDRTSLAILPRITQSGLAGPAQVAAIGDVNGDGFGDVAVAAMTNRSSRTYLFYLGSPAGPSSTAWFTRAYGGIDIYPQVAACDFNGDHISDFALENPVGPRIEVFLGQTGVAPTTPIAAFSPEGQDGFAVGDFDGDGYCDLVATNGSTSVRVHFGGSTPFGPREQTITRTNNVVLSVGDMNRDGYDDVLIGNHVFSSTDSYSLHLGGSAGLQTTVPSSASFSVRLQPGTGAYPAVGAVDDMDGDGMLDLAYVDVTPDPDVLHVRPWTAAGWAAPYMSTVVGVEWISSR